MSGIDDDVIPGEDGGAPLIDGRRREHHLVEGARGAAIPAHPVHHAEEGRDAEHRPLRAEEQRQATQRGKDGEDDQVSPAPESIGEESGAQHAAGVAREPEPDREPDHPRARAALRQVERKEHAHEAGRRGAEPRRDEDAEAIGGSRVPGHRAASTRETYGG